MSGPILLVWLGLALLATMSACCWVLVRQDRLERATARRVQQVASRHARANPLARMGRPAAPLHSLFGALMGRAKALFGFHPDWAERYPMRPGLVVLLALVVAVVLAQLASEVAGPSARLAIPVLWIMGSRTTFRRFQQRHAAKLYIQFPDALAMIVRSVRVGIPVSEAVRNVSREALEPTCTEFALLSDQIAIGVALEDALLAMASRNHVPEYRFFATALSLQAQTGGGLSETLENLADVIRRRVGVRNRAHAMASEARTSTYVLAALPVFTGGALGVLNPSYILLLFTDPTGQIVLAIAIFMLGSGLGVMRSIIARSLR